MLTLACTLTASQQSFDSGSRGTAAVISANAYFRPEGDDCAIAKQTFKI
jgi:hypothetical protein